MKFYGDKWLRVKHGEIKQLPNFMTRLSVYYFLRCFRVVDAHSLRPTFYETHVLFFKGRAVNFVTGRFSAYKIIPSVLEK